MRIKLFLVICVFLIQNSFAQEERVVSLEELNVSADWQKEFSEAGQSVKVLNKEQIANLPIQSVDELLESISGIDVRQRGVGSTQADISLRGGTFDQVLLLLNGVSITDPQTGHHLLDLPIEFSEIDRVEVLQGTAARKYGNQAFSGAINIITIPQSKPTLSAELTAGSFDSFSQKASLSGGSKNINAFFTLAHRTSEGYIQNTDFQTLNSFGQVQYRDKGVGQLEMQMGYQNKSFGANGFYSLKYPNQFEHTQTKFASLKWARKTGDFLWNATASWRNHYDRFELFRDNIDAPVWYVSHNYHLTDVLGAKVSLSYFSNLGKFNFGLGSKSDHIYSTVLGEAMSQPVKNPFQEGIVFTKEKSRLVNNLDFEYTRSLNHFNFAAGFSANQSQLFGWQWHYGTDISWHPSDISSYFVSMNTASRLPTFTDLYYQSATQIANPHLIPEKSANFELGGKMQFGLLNTQASVFHRSASNVIDWVLLPGEEKWQSRNLTQINTSGLDMEITYTLNKYSFKEIKCSYSYIFNSKPTQDFDSKYAMDYLKHHFYVSIGQQVSKSFSLLWHANYFDRAGSYTDFYSGLLTDYQAYFKLNLRGVYKIRSSSIYVDIQNLTNTQYADYGGLVQPGILVLAGVKFVLE